MMYLAPHLTHILEDFTYKMVQVNHGQPNQKKRSIGL